jgi:hypothetical protein
VYVGSESQSLVIGIPCPALAFEYLTAQDCFLLGIVLQLVAAHGIGKSALLAEFIRWFDLAGGGGIVAENETKFNPFWYQSVLDPGVFERTHYTAARAWRTGSGTSRPRSRWRRRP